MGVYFPYTCTQNKGQSGDTAKDFEVNNKKYGLCTDS